MHPAPDDGDVPIGDDCDDASSPELARNGAPRYDNGDLLLSDNIFTAGGGGGNFTIKCDSSSESEESPSHDEHDEAELVGITLMISSSGEAEEICRT